MISTLYLQTAHCFRDAWLEASDVYWACSSTSRTTAKIYMSRTGGRCPGGEGKYIKVGETATFGNGAYTCTLKDSWEGTATVLIKDVVKEEISMTKAQIISNHSDKLGYNVGDIIKSECVVKNIGTGGTIYLTVGVGYVDSSNMIFLTGTPTTDQLFLNYGQSYTFKEDVRVDITDYYRQQGIGWAYLKQQMYLFFLVGHKVNGDMVWDTERHIKIYLETPEEFVDPTSLDESLVGDIEDIVEETIPAFGGLGGLAGLLPGAEDIIDPELERDIMPFLYIGFMGFIGYLLIRSQ